MYAEDELLPISALQHLVFCPRQCALIHLEAVWEDNAQTAQGALMHEQVHATGGETQGHVRLVQALPLRSLRLGLAGQADLVELDYGDKKPDLRRVPVSAFPVEYKRGRPKAHDADLVQLAAQALCLEEMLGITVARGAIFYGKRKRRTGVEFTPGLRRKTEERARELHAMVAAGRTPAAEYDPAKCDACSLQNVCLPRVTDQSRSARAYLARMKRESP